VKNGKKGRKVPVVLTDEERKALLEVPGRRAPTGKRNLAMLYLMLDAGLRSCEVVGKERRNGTLEGGLRLNHVDLNTGQLRIEDSKGGSDRILWLNETALDAFREWRAIRPQAKTDLVFTTLRGGKIDNRYIRQFVDTYARRAGIQKKVHPHTLRHTFATDYYRKTKDLRALQKILGHASISTTEIYTHIVDDEVENSMRDFRKT